jgi:dTDP-4-amino-4,6-dideoxygalactose transaminase
MNKILTLLNLICRPGYAGGQERLAEYERAFSETVLDDAKMPCLSFWRGRVALWTILKALNICQGDDVIIPAYTCEMVPAAVKFAGGKCRYCDVEQSSFNSSHENIRQLLTSRTRAIICQHTYGFIQDVRALTEMVKDCSGTVIEDCCQMADYDSRNTGAGITGAAAFFSTQWSKPYSTGLGGMAVFSDRLLYEKSKKIRDSFSDEFKLKQAWRLALQVLIYKLTVFPRTKAIMAALYRVLQQVGMIQGTTTIAEYGDVMPDNYLAGAANVQAALGLQQLQAWQDNVKHRRELTAFYLEKLGEFGIDISLLRDNSGGRALWVVPILVENKQDILQRAGRSGLPVATWFNRLPVHIASDTAARYDYKPGQCPRSERLFMSEIHLLTAPSVTFKLAEKAANMIKQYAHIINY